jgi:hypothetical protein
MPDDAKQTEIINLALLQLGGVTIAGVSEASRSAGVMAALWTPMLKDVLRDHAWPFAKKRVTLTVTTTPVFGWDAAYTLPTDLMRMVCLGEPDEGLKWKIEGTTLVCNESSANILYVRYVDVATGPAGASETGLYDSKFETALAYRLAAEGAEAITGRTGRREEMLKLYQTALTDAETISSQEQTADEQAPSGWVDARN